MMAEPPVDTQRMLAEGVFFFSAGIATPFPSTTVVKLMEASFSIAVSIPGVYCQHTYARYRGCDLFSPIPDSFASKT